MLPKFFSSDLQTFSASVVETGTATQLFDEAWNALKFVDDTDALRVTRDGWIGWLAHIIARCFYNTPKVPGICVLSRPLIVLHTKYRPPQRGSLLVTPAVLAMELQTT